MALLLSRLGSFTFKSSWLVLSLLFGRAGAVCPLPPVSEGAQLTTITHDGVSRSWYTYVTIVVMFVALIALAGRWLCKKRLPPLADAGVLETVRPMTTAAAIPTAPATTPPPPPRTATTNSVAASRVQTLEIISQGHCDDGGVLQFGQLLQWMDIAACLSAERHAHLNAVTLVMDELSVESVAVRMGDIVRLEGVVNAAFSSSMEVGVTVHAESPGDASERPVCSAG